MDINSKELKFLISLYEKELNECYDGNHLVSGEIALIRVEYLDMLGYKEESDEE